MLQILVNLIGNAIKFTDHGVITVRAHVQDANAVFQVRDTGVGISPAETDHIFDLFWQGDQGPTRRVGGTGIGLNVSSRLAELMGGRLTAESVRREGSTFTLVPPPPKKRRGRKSRRQATDSAVSCAAAVASLRLRGSSIPRPSSSTPSTSADEVQKGTPRPKRSYAKPAHSGTTTRASPP